RQDSTTVTTAGVRRSTGYTESSSATLTACCRYGCAGGLCREAGRGRRVVLPQYLYQVAYTSESLAAQIKNPQDRLEVVGKQLNDAVGARILAGGYSYGEYDISVVVDAPDDVTMAAVAVAVAAGGAVRAAKTTPLLNGSQWLAALRKAPAVTAQYRPAR